MKKNMGIADRTVRAIIAIVIAILYYTEVISGTLGIVLLVLGCIFLLTSIISLCPLYLPFGCNTIKKEKTT
ncbi:YgaP family membrane protein [Sunxiuqinia sp. A32]|uniref:YgaP family membrane protein n=1 Tax=Sunxiuqinia sp. A32 TaxID=3461496 RepID=UPI0040452A81